MNMQQRPGNQREGSNDLILYNMNIPKKLWLPAMALAGILIVSIFFFSFVNPSYDEEAALKMKPSFVGNTRVYD